MISFLENFAPADSPIGHPASPAMGERECAAQHDVGAVPQHQVEDELDGAIRELGEAFMAAYERGDKAAARELHNRQIVAILSRTPEHKARLEKAIQDRITNGLDYFQSPAALALGGGRIG